jgi:drug/metabolite transporter (DMT)-like permease
MGASQASRGSENRGGRALWASIALVLVTLIWGSTFVVIKDRLGAMPPSILVALRFSIGALLLLPAGVDRGSLRAGIPLGVIMFVGFGTQTIGLGITGAARAAFITGLSAVMVPWVASRLLGERVPRGVWAASALAVAGLGMLCFDLTPPNRGDAWVLACAVAWTVYILALERPARRLARGVRGALRLTSVQVATVAVLGWLWSLPSLPVLSTLDGTSWLAMAYLGVVATAVTTLLQVLGQRVLSSPQTAIVFTLEPVWAALFAWILLGEVLGLQGWIGGLLVLAGMVLAQRGSSTAP